MSRVASLRRVAGIDRNRWPVYTGIGGRLRLDWMAEITGIRSQLTQGCKETCLQVSTPL
jgi:hypothetical protein